MTASRLSVIMPMHNAAPFVETAIDSILAQTMRDFTFYIIDDGSSDGSGHIAARKAAEDSRIRLICQENRGIVTSLNRMLALVSTPYVARMDADDISLPTRFQQQLDRLDAAPTLGALGTQFTEIDVHGRVIDEGAWQPVGTAAVRAQLEIRQPIANPTAMFRTQALRDAGLYRQAFRYCEDYDMFLRLSEIADIDNLPDMLFHYRRSPGQMSVANNVRQTRQAVYARFAYRERLAGRGDPFAGLEDLPPTEELDRLTARPGTGAAMDATILAELRFSIATMNRGDFAYVCDRVSNGICFSDSGRTLLRCLANRQPGRAARLAWAFVRGWWAARRSAKQPILA